MGLAAVELEGRGPIDWRASPAHNVLQLVDRLFFYLVDAIIVWSSGMKRSRRDKVADHRHAAFAASIVGIRHFTILPIMRLSFSLFVLLGILLGAANADTVSTGSGFFVTRDGYFVTNFHVVEKATSLVVRDATGKHYPTIVVRVDKANDLALLKCEGTFKPVAIASSQEVRRGDRVFTLGFPNVAVQGNEAKYTEGVISSLSGLQDEPTNFQITVPIQPGNSGGPLISNQGNVIGIVRGKLDASFMQRRGSALPENVNYALKSNYLLELLSTVGDAKRGLIPAHRKSVEVLSNLAEQAENSVGMVIGTALSQAPETTSARPQAGEPRYENIVLSDVKEGAAKKVFGPNTPQVFLAARLADVPSGSKLKCVWIAEKTKAAPPNYEIDKTELTGGGAINRVTFSLSRPNAGWPAGDYRVDLFVNNKPASIVRFSVAPK